MPVVPRTARIRIADTATGTIFREWVATAATQDSAAGATVDITITQTTAGGTPPGEAETLTLNLYTDAGALIRTYALTPASASQIVTFALTATGIETGLPRAGTVEIAIRATRTSAVAYDVESDGTPNTPPTGHVTTLDRGWIRGTTTATTTLSNVALGGAKLSPAEYDESLFARTTLAAALYVARALTVAISGTTPALTAATNSSTAGPWDATCTGVTDERFPAALTTAATSLTVPNATLTGLPATVLTTTNDSMTVDPRITATHHFQVDDDVFGVVKNVASRQMLSTESGFLWTILRGSRGSGRNGITLTQTLTPLKPGTAISSSGVSSTQDGVAGVSARLDWTSSKPGGTWNKTTDITFPADIDADAYLAAGTDSNTLLAPDPNIIGWPYLAVANANEADHAHPGDTLTVVLTISHIARRQRITNATDVECSLVRFDTAANRYEFLAADQATWVEWTTASVIVSHALTETGAGTGVYTHDFDTAAWGDLDILGVSCSWKVDGTPYEAVSDRELVGRAHSHASVGGALVTAQTTIS